MGRPVRERGRRGVEKNERIRSESSQLFFLDVTSILSLLSLLFRVYQWVIRSRIWLHNGEGHH